MIETQNELPFNISLEQAILGVLLNKNTAFDQISNLIRFDDFFEISHQKLFQHMAERLNQGKIVDLITLSGFIKEQKLDYNYVEELSSNLFPTDNIKQYAEILSELSVRRKLISLGKNLIENGKQEKMKISEQIEKAEQAVLSINSSSESYKIVKFFDGASDILQFTSQIISGQINNTGIKSGFNQLDALTGGFRPGELIILAGRPSMGKTALSLNMCTNMILQNHKSVLFLSLEMPYEQICLRIISSLSKIPLNNLLHAKMSQKAIQECLNSLEQFKSMKFYILDTSFLTPSSFRTIARQMKRQHNIDVIVLDYLQLMEGSKRNESREQEISYISRSLKLLAKEMGVPLIALSQMSRDIEKRKDLGEPKLSDLRGSGSIEQDADSILFLFKEDDDILLSVAKNRNGALGKVKLNYLGEITKFISV